ncbi:MAG: hypothetical protein ACT4OM_04790 [Actinomycetota bacterium]
MPSSLFVSTSINGPMPSVRLAGRGSASPALPPGRVWTLAAAGALIAVMMNWPLVTRVSWVTEDSLDRYFQSWQLAWIGHAALTDPAGVWDSNTFWPLDDSLAFSDAAVGYAPLALFGEGPRAAMIRYNLLSVFAGALAVFGAGLLARQLGVSWPAALVAGAAFGFAPWRLAHINHLHVLSSGGIPLALFLLLRGWRSRSAGLLFAGWAAAAWQLTLGFTLGIPFAYLLAGLVALALAGWCRSGRPALPGRLVSAAAGGVALFLAVAAWQAQPFFRVLHEHPESRRTPEYVALYSPPASGFLVAPPSSILWGAATEPARSDLGWPPEMALFPGIVVSFLALAGLAFPVYAGSTRLLLTAGVLGSALLAMGYSFAGGALYDVFYDLAPGWQASRTPGRLFTFTSLALALLAGAGVHSLAVTGNRSRPAAPPGGAPGPLPGAVSPAAPPGGAPGPLPCAVSPTAPRPRRPVLPNRRTTAALLPALAVLAILAEGFGRTTMAPLPQAPVTYGLLPGPQLHLPTDAIIDPLHMLWSTDGFPRLVNGYAGFTPAAQEQLRLSVETFPDRTSVEVLRQAKVATVVVHESLTGDTPWAGSAVRSLQGLGVQVERSSTSSIYSIDPISSQPDP